MFAAALALTCASMQPPDADAFDIRHPDDQPNQQYILHEPSAAEAPEDGFGLLVVLPGGDGSVDFAPFVQRIHELALPEDFALVQLIAPKWSDDQEIVWPTQGNPEEGQEFTTEEFIGAVVAEVEKAVTVDSNRVYALAWSSSGPAVYDAMLRDDTPLDGAMIAMSVFKPDRLPPLDKAAGRRFYLLHSPDDRTCPFRMAEEARDRLAEAGAAVYLETYAGGHGWRGPVYQWIGEGLAWLHNPESQATEPETGEAGADSDQ